MNDDLQWNRAGKLQVLLVLNVWLEGEKTRRGKTGIGIEIVEIFFFFVEIKRIAKGKNKSNGISNDTKYKSYLF